MKACTREGNWGYTPGASLLFFSRLLFTALVACKGVLELYRLPTHVLFVLLFHPRSLPYQVPGTVRVVAVGVIMCRIRASETNLHHHHHNHHNQQHHHRRRQRSHDMNSTPSPQRLFLFRFVLKALRTASHGSDSRDGSSGGGIGQVQIQHHCAGGFGRRRRRSSRPPGAGSSYASCRVDEQSPILPRP